MKKFTFLFALLAFLTMNVLGQSPVFKTNPAMDSKNVINIQFDKNDGVTASIENSVVGETYLLIQLDPSRKIETIKGNGSTIEFSKLNFTSKETKYYTVQKMDSKLVGSFKVNAKASLK